MIQSQKQLSFRIDYSEFVIHSLQGINRVIFIRFHFIFIRISIRIEMDKTETNQNSVHVNVTQNKLVIKSY